MPQIFRIGSYVVYFWMNENDPLEPNNNSKIPDRRLKFIC